MEKESFEFTLILKGVDPALEELGNKLFEAACDDTLLYSRNKTVYLDFVREAHSLEETILSAIRAVETIDIDGVRVASVEPGDLVTSAEIARRLDCSREAVRLLINGERGKGNFPTPVAGVTTTTQIWRWTEVLTWYAKNQKIPTAEEMLKQAYTFRELNETLAARESPGIYKKVGQLVEKLQPPTRD